MNQPRRSMLVLLSVAALATALSAGAPRAAEQVACGAPDELLDPGAPLPATARAVSTGALRMLIVGSASVLGPGTSGPAAAWPARLEALLAAHYPGLTIETVVRGAPGLTAADSMAMVRDELRRSPAQLVLWQTGAVEAVRNLDLDELAATLDMGLKRVSLAGADAVLIDPQFSRTLRANANVEPYREAMKLVAAAHNAPVVRRYDLMYAWAEADKVDLERAPRSGRVAAADRLNDCLAQAIAALLIRGIAEGKAQARP
jgi:acyl-CoA thioesterase I